ncbi:MAG: lasso peptide biosynthesis B2 protein [Hyphomicrobiaceae bacterium]|nr:lasso peptide biosynthesis B2 protein [Hyphomicrobiaceae bacterium]
MLVVRKLRFRLALWCWARLVPALAWKRNLNSLLALAADPGSASPYRGLAPDYTARRVKRAVRRPWLMRDRPCLREGVLAMRFLRLAGYRPELHFAVDRTSVVREVLSAHCWVVLDGRPLLNAPTASMVEVLVYSGDRMTVPAPAAAPVAHR